MDGNGLRLLARYPAAPRRLLSVDDYHRMGEAGILNEGDRVELIEGELVEMAPIGSEHAAAVNDLTRLLIMAVGDRAVVSPQNPVRLDQHSEPQPDFAVLKPRRDGYRSALPTPQDTLLIVEVAHSSLAYDRAVKLALYASHGIPEVWIANIPAKEVEVYRRPNGDHYDWTEPVGRSGIVKIEALPGASVKVDRIFA
jgi:Uma2 family endonuclease